MEVNEEKDLPLMANADEIRVKHYMLNLSFDFASKTVQGQCILFCQPVKEKKTNEDFSLVLDARHILTSFVGEVTHEPHEAEQILTDFEQRKSLSAMKHWFNKPCKPICFEDESWSLKIWKANVKSNLQFPRAVKITWTTGKEGKSLLWRMDQSGHPAVFTPAAAVNNRSLFPCQEPPIALASWQSILKVDQNKDFKIFCTGDENALVNDNGEHYFFTQMILPMSTFAVAIGKWSIIKVCSGKSIDSTTEKQIMCQKLHEFYPCHITRGDVGPILPTRIIGPESLANRAHKKWKDYLVACLESAYELLGPHPFTKLDLCIVPRCYNGLGLASPSLMFVSQSTILGKDTGMHIRIAHEISHNWFGLVIGALDWTEEWLSEVRLFFSP